MKGDKRTQCLPKLRFPEFADAPEWEERMLDDVCETLNNRRVPITSSDRRPGQYPYYGASGIVDYVDDYIFDERLVLVGEDGAKWGAFEPTAFVAEGKYWVNNHAHVLRPHATKDTLLAHYLTMIDLAKFVTGAAPPKLTLGKLKTIPIPLSPCDDEHEAIADCLSSLDHLISAEGRKHDVLRQHKQGLMQQLFPQDGETKPRLRFQEFRKAAEWKPQRLDEVSPHIFDGTHQTPTYTKAGVPFYSVENLISGTANKFISRDDYLEATQKNKPEKGDILLTRIGKIGHCQAVTWDHEFSVYVTLAVIKASTSFDTNYLAYYLQSGCYQAELTRKSLQSAVPPKINMDSLRSTRVLLPGKEEQIKIANCLSPLDDQISAQAKKLDLLERHKQGLLQQLFPVLGDEA